MLYISDINQSFTKSLKSSVQIDDQIEDKKISRFASVDVLCQELKALIEVISVYSKTLIKLISNYEQAVKKAVCTRMTSQPPTAAPLDPLPSLWQLASLIGRCGLGIICTALVGVGLNNTKKNYQLHYQLSLVKGASPHDLINEVLQSEKSLLEHAEVMSENYSILSNSEPNNEFLKELVKIITLCKNEIKKMHDDLQRTNGHKEIATVFINNLPTYTEAVVQVTGVINQFNNSLASLKDLIVEKQLKIDINSYQPIEFVQRIPRIQLLLKEMSKKFPINNEIKRALTDCETYGKILNDRTALGELSDQYDKGDKGAKSNALNKFSSLYSSNPNIKKFVDSCYTRFLQKGKPVILTNFEKTICTMVEKAHEQANNTNQRVRKNNH